MRGRRAPSGTFVLTSEGDMGEEVGILVVESLTDDENTVMLYRAYRDGESGVTTPSGALALALRAQNHLSSLLLQTMSAFDKRRMKESLDF